MNEKNLAVLDAIRTTLAVAAETADLIGPGIARAFAGMIREVTESETEDGTEPEDCGGGEPLPDIPDWRDNPERGGVREEKILRGILIALIREDIAGLVTEGKLSAALQKITKVITPHQFACVMELPDIVIKGALRGAYDPSFITRFTEIFGIDGGAKEEECGHHTESAHTGKPEKEEAENTGVFASPENFRGLVNAYYDTVSQTQKQPLPLSELLNKMMSETGVNGVQLGSWLGVSRKLVSNVRCGRPSPAFSAAWKAFLAGEQEDRPGSGKIF